MEKEALTKKDHIMLCDKHLKEINANISEWKKLLKIAKQQEVKDDIHREIAFCHQQKNQVKREKQYYKELK